MILVITAHDTPTSDNLAVANILAVDAAMALLEQEAVRHHIVPALTDFPDTPLLMFSHGQLDHLVGHDNSLALSAEDVGLLNSRETFAYACHTAGHLGPIVSNAGGTWFGFAGPVNALPPEMEVRNHFERIARFISHRFPGCSTQIDAEQFVSDLDHLAEQIFAEIDDSGAATFEQLHALRDVTRRLRICLPDVDNPIKHPEAVGDPIF